MEDVPERFYEGLLGDEQSISTSKSTRKRSEIKMVLGKKSIRRVCQYGAVDNKMQQLKNKKRIEKWKVEISTMEDLILKQSRMGALFLGMRTWDSVREEDFKFEDEPVPVNKHKHTMLLRTKAEILTMEDPIPKQSGKEISTMEDSIPKQSGEEISTMEDTEISTMEDPIPKQSGKEISTMEDSIPKQSGKEISTMEDPISKHLGKEIPIMKKRIPNQSIRDGRLIESRRRETIIRVYKKKLLRRQVIFIHKSLLNLGSISTMEELSSFINKLAEEIALHLIDDEIIKLQWSLRMQPKLQSISTMEELIHKQSGEDISTVEEQIHKQSAEEISTVEEQIHKQSMDMLLIRNLIARRIMKLLSVKESISTKKEPIPKQLAEGFVLQLSAILLVDKISILYTKPEVIVICVDTCYVMTTKPEGGGLLKAQTKAILLYAEEKIKAHDGNQVGLLAMGSMQGPCMVEPTRDLDEIRFALKGLVCIGESEIPIGMVLSFFSNSKLPKRRLVVFSGGPLNMNFAQVQNYAKALKDYKVAVDVVNFGMQFFQKTKKELLEAFAEAADNCGNSRYLYAPSGSKLSLSEHIIRSLLAPWSLPMQEKEKKEDEVQKIEKAVDKLDRKKKHMTKNLSSVLAPKGLSMREAKKKEKQAENIDKKRICYEKEEKAFWELLYSQGWYPVERESETQME